MLVFRKRGLSADVFTWILASIVGVFILVFFYRFATQHIDVSETLTERQLAEHLADTLDAFGMASSSTTTLSFRDDVHLRFQCGSVGTGMFVKDLRRVIFAPQSIEGDALSLWTEAWTFPFPVTNFYYITTKNIRTFLVYDDASVAFLQRFTPPKGMNIQSVHIKNLDLQELQRQTQGLAALRLVYLTPAKNVDVILKTFRAFTPALVEVDLDAHRVSFPASGDETFYLGDAMLYGVFFAPEQFPCLQRKALERLWQVASVLEQRARLLRGKTSDLTCSDLLYQASTAYAQMIGAADGDALYSLQEQIQDSDQLLRKNGCVGAY